jgi:4-hydroxy-tetrahydrodipicolinate synthase
MKPATAQKRIEGVLSPVITPFKRDLSADPDRFVKHCKWLMKSGCAGLAVFGTNSEANSMSVEQKLELLEALVKGGVPAASLMPGTGHSALTDSVKTRERRMAAAACRCCRRSITKVSRRRPVP